MDDQSPLFDCLCFQMRLAARRLTGFYESRLAAEGLTIAQFGLLAEVGRMKDASIGDLAVQLELDPSSLSRTLSGLERAGLIAIARDTRNRRVRRVRLSAAGKAKLRAAAEIWRAAQAEAARRVPAEDVKALLAATEALSAP